MELDLEHTSIYTPAHDGIVVTSQKDIYNTYKSRTGENISVKAGEVYLVMVYTDGTFDMPNIKELPESYNHILESFALPQNHWPNP